MSLFYSLKPAQAVEFISFKPEGASKEVASKLKLIPAGQVKNPSKDYTYQMMMGAIESKTVETTVPKKEF